ncbi:MAG: chlorophyllide a reductase iron protein subunit X, partial [Dehalococcoidia bacterium]|nr:chlorophyllide a reductase iron protein subunit X [Dehalococcoidia bacterium]
VPRFDAIFGDLADRIHRRAIPPCVDYEPLEYHAFLRVFGAEEPPGRPSGATPSDLMAGAPTPTLRKSLPVVVIEQVQTSDPLLASVRERLTAIGLHVTDLDRTDSDGVTVTCGEIEIRLGAPDDLDAKIAFLAALRRSGAEFTFVDVRYADAPLYR